MNETAWLLIGCAVGAFSAAVVVALALCRAAGGQEPPSKEETP